MSERYFKGENFKFEYLYNEEEILSMYYILTSTNDKGLFIKKPKEFSDQIKDDIFCRKFEYFCINLCDSALINGKFMKAINLVDDICSSKEINNNQKIFFCNYYLTPNISHITNLSHSEDLYYKYLVNFCKIKQDTLNYPIIDVELYKKYLS